VTRTGTRTELALLARTAVHLKPSQAAQRARLRAQRAALRRWPQAGQPGSARSTRGSGHAGLAAPRCELAASNCSG
jgi:hypothetical protein